MTIDWFSNWGQDSVGRALAEGRPYILAFLISFLIALALTPICRWLVRRLGMIDKPSARRINRTPIPRGGGISVILAVQLTISLYFYLHGPISTAFNLHWLYAFLWGSTALAIVGFGDDKYNLRAPVKLGFQFLVAAYFYLNGVHVGGIFVAFPPWLDFTVTIFWIAGVINAFNLIDGLDGLASGICLIASLGMAGGVLFKGDISNTLPYIALAGACLGFLRYNFHPASVFLGDTGSMFLGLCVATFPLLSGHRMSILPAVGIPLLAMGVPLFDTMLAIWRRSVRALLPHKIGTHIAVMGPDTDHIHHRLLGQFLDQKTVALYLYLFSFGLVTVGLGGILLDDRAPGFFMLAFMVATIIIVRNLMRVELWDTGRLLSGTRISIRKGLIIPLYVIYDLLTLSLACATGFYFSGIHITPHILKTDFPVLIGSVFIVLAFANVYKRVWSRAQIRDYAFLAIALLGGILLGNALRWLLYDSPTSLIGDLMMFFLSCSFVIGIRVWNDLYLAIMQFIDQYRLAALPTSRHVLVYGAGLRFRNYLREQETSIGRKTDVLIGILDDDRLLWERIVMGFTVFGGLDQFPELVERHNISKLVITCKVSEEQLAHLRRLAAENGIALSLWTTEEVPIL